MTSSPSSKRRGKTIILVTHSLVTVQRFCDEAIWLDDGQIADRGDPPRVIQAYLTKVAEAEERFLSEDDRRKIEATAPDRVEAEPSDAALTEEEPPADMFRASEDDGDRAKRPSRRYARG